MSIHGFQELLRLPLFGVIMKDEVSGYGHGKDGDHRDNDVSDDLVATFIARSVLLEI